MTLFHHQHVRVGRRGFSRRSFLQGVSAAAAAAGTLSFRDLMGLQAAELRRQGRAMVLLWMSGGPSQFETFDPKPGHANGGPTEAIETSAPGIRIAADWEQTAQVMDEIALVRSLVNREGNHQRATYQLHTGYLPSGSVKHPNLGSSLAKELADPEFDLPAVVSVGPTVGAGFLGVEYEPFLVGNPGQVPQNVSSAVPSPRLQRRLGLLGRLEDEFTDRGGEVVVENHRQLYDRASRMVLSPNVRAFDLADEPRRLRQRYGENNFGRGCLLARRLVEAGVTFVEVISRGWDTHDNNFERSTNLSRQVDPAMAALIADLKDRGLLERTLVVWMGEFGRTPRINARTGRDHWPRGFSIALAGAGVQGGRVIGSTTADGTNVRDRRVSVGDLFASVCHALGVDPQTENLSPLGRPLKIVEEGEVVSELFA